MWNGLNNPSNTRDVAQEECEAVEVDLDMLAPIHAITPITLVPSSVVFQLLTHMESVGSTGYQITGIQHCEI